MSNEVGVDQGRLRMCPDAPHCVSSDDDRDDHHIEPLAVAGDADAAWAKLRAYMSAQPRVRLVTDDGDYLHITFTSRLMRFVDDVEFHRRAAPDGTALIAMRSCSRLGYYDFKVNRERLEALRDALRQQGVVR